MVTLWSRAAIVAMGIGIVVALPAASQDEAREAKPAPAAKEEPPAPAAEGEQEKAPPPETADIAITATVRAREMQHHVPPQTEVKFSGQPKRRTGVETHRKNFPRDVQPEVIYRDIEVRWTISSVFDDIDRIVQEAMTPKAQAPREAQPKGAAPPAPARGERRSP